MDWFGGLIAGAIELSSRSGQRKLARFCYQVVRLRFMHQGKRNVPNWEKLSEEEQAIWMSCVWEVLEDTKEG